MCHTRIHLLNHSALALSRALSRASSSESETQRASAHVIYILGARWRATRSSEIQPSDAIWPLFPDPDFRARDRAREMCSKFELYSEFVKAQTTSQKPGKTLIFKKSANHALIRQVFENSSPWRFAGVFCVLARARQTASDLCTSNMEARKQRQNGVRGPELGNTYMCSYVHICTSLMHSLAVSESLCFRLCVSDSLHVYIASFVGLFLYIGLFVESRITHTDQSV